MPRPRGNIATQTEPADGSWKTRLQDPRHSFRLACHLARYSATLWRAAFRAISLDTVKGVETMRTISTLEPTRYEIAARHIDGRAFLVCYAAGSPSRQRLLRALQSKGDAIISRCGIGADDQMTFTTKPRPAAMVAGWTLAYSGRTQRDVRSAGQGAELEFIAA